MKWVRDRWLEIRTWAAVIRQTVHPVKPIVLPDALIQRFARGFWPAVKPAGTRLAVKPAGTRLADINMKTLKARQTMHPDVAPLEIHTGGRLELSREHYNGPQNWTMTALLTSLPEISRAQSHFDSGLPLEVSMVHAGNRYEGRVFVTHIAHVFDHGRMGADVTMVGNGALTRISEW